MSQADIFVLADDLQYTSHGLINRARIKNARGWQWLTVPVLTAGRGLQKINEVRIDPSRNWALKHWKSLYVNYKNAPYFEWYEEFFKQLFHSRWKYLVELNITAIEFICQALGIKTSLFRSSRLPKAREINQRLVKWLKHLGCDTYLVEETYRQYLKMPLFEEVRFITFQPPVYHQLFGSFIPNLSVVDLLFNEGEKSREVL
ncbi:MAG: WbqC family protein, partial [candidate division KSB1 bacterium]|nr:WbqC family protein [candidate division KSB1 bacterium]